MDLRPFEESDWDTLAPWFDAEGGEWMGRRKWLEAAARKALYEPDRHRLLVGSIAGVAVVLFSVSRNPGDDRAVVSLIVEAGHRKKGVARAAARAIGAEYPDVQEFVSYVDDGNAASRALMDALGFVRAPRAERLDKDRFVLRRDGSPLPNRWTPPEIGRG